MDGARIGYARVSTQDQNLDLQRDALQRVGCTEIFDEKSTGSKSARPALTAALASLKPGDILVVWRLDRLGRSLKHLIETMQELERRGIGFQSLSEGIDSKSPTGKLLFHVIGAVAEFERSLISERTRAGLQASKRRGQTLGRPRRMSSLEVERARTLAAAGRHSLADIARELNAARSTVRRVLARK